MQRRAKKFKKLYMEDLLELTETDSEIEFVQLCSGGITQSVRPVWATVQRMPEDVHYAINYPFIRFYCPDIKGNQEVFEHERIA